MRVVCAWCSKEISACPVNDGLVSHGMCGLCRRGFLGERWISIKDLIRDTPFPVMLVDREMKVKAMSGPAATGLGASASGDSMRLAGVVIGCVNSGLPGGCGHSSECGGCILRNTATATFADGKPRNGVTSVHRLNADGGVRDVQITFSVERIDAGVMLYVEDIRDRAAGTAV